MFTGYKVTIFTLANVSKYILERVRSWGSSDWVRIPHIRFPFGIGFPRYLISLAALCVWGFSVSNWWKILCLSFNPIPEMHSLYMVISKWAGYASRHFLVLPYQRNRVRFSIEGVNSCGCLVLAFLPINKMSNNIPLWVLVTQLRDQILWPIPYRLIRIKRKPFGQKV